MSARLKIRLAVRALMVELSAFGAWWLHELRDAYVPVAERFAPQSTQRFTLNLCGERAVLIADRAASADAVLSFACAREAGLPLLPKHLPEGTPAGARVSVLLPATAVLFQEVRVPPVPERDLARAIELHLERESPLPLEQLYTAWHVLEKKPDGSRSVEVAMSRRQYIERLRDTFRAWGWRVLSVRCAAKGPRAAIDLLPSSAHRLSLKFDLRERRLAWSSAALFVVYASVIAGQWSYERFTLAETLKAARSQMIEIARLQAQLDRQSKPVRAIQELIARQTSADALAALSAAVAMDTWIFQADISTPVDGDAMMSIEGYTPSAAALTGALRQSARFGQVELQEATNAGPDSPLSRVKLKIGLRSGAAR